MSSLLTVPQALALLQLQPGATKKQIRAAYKRLALQLHPDKQTHTQHHAGRPEKEAAADASAAFALLSEAYSLLLQEREQQQQHHQHGAGHSSSSSSSSSSTAAADQPPNGAGPQQPPFEAAYASGALFCEQLLDEAVAAGCSLLDIQAL
jgi:curved DNA-binding protein CbpA